MYIHLSSGVSGLAASLIVGKRKGFAHVYRNARDLGQGSAELPPHNILLVCLRVYVPGALYYAYVA